MFIHTKRERNTPPPNVQQYKKEKTCVSVQDCCLLAEMSFKRKDGFD